MNSKEKLGQVRDCKNDAIKMRIVAIKLMTENWRKIPQPVAGIPLELIKISRFLVGFLGA